MFAFFNFRAKNLHVHFWRENSYMRHFLVIFKHCGKEYNKISCCQEPVERSPSKGPKIRMQVILNWISNIFFSCQRHRNFLFFPPHELCISPPPQRFSPHGKSVFEFPFPSLAAVTIPALETPFYINRAFQKFTIV